MDIRSNTLDVFFRRIQPEVLLDSLERMPSAPWERHPHLSQGVDWKIFQRYAHAFLGAYSADEVENIYFYADQWMRRPEEICQGPEKSALYLPALFAGELLTLADGEPLCRAERLLAWRSISIQLGQDLLTCAWLALKDLCIQHPRVWFGWPPQLHSDDSRLKALLDQGVAENHYHLYGSTRHMELSWTALMNHPRDIDRYLSDQKARKLFRENLNPNLLLGAQEQMLPWNQRIKCAAWFRILLFQRLMGPIDPDQIRDDWLEFRSGRHSVLWQKVKSARFQFGRKYPMSNGTRRCLDYADHSGLTSRQGDGFHRALMGERAFLYNCFRMCFSGEFTAMEQDMFYAYLLLKSNFRSEIVQVNQRVGFQNFQRYQDRKNVFLQEYEYSAEGLHLSINGAMADSCVTSLEARISPRKDSKELCGEIAAIDREVLFAKDIVEGGGSLGIRFSQRFLGNDQRMEEIWAKQLNHFYVLHFGKRKLQRKVRSSYSGNIKPRNSDVRGTIRKQALDLATAFTRHSWLCGRIRGIDACSTEIGCRPETFATEFRFLQNFIPPFQEKKIWEATEPILPRLGVTYHAGEDFLDLPDGLRAIDEAVSFLELDRGDRLGHALALGVEPGAYYDSKHYQITLPRQDHLDDLVWLLFRSLELGVEIPSSLRSHLMNEANRLLEDVYCRNLRPGSPHPSLQDYYYSWRCRGDHPTLYRNILRSEAPTDSRTNPVGQLSLRWLYDRSRALSGSYVCTQTQRELLHLYHYGREEREQGNKIDLIHISGKFREPYIYLLRQMQDGLRQSLSNHGIAVECNPSSNVLIGTFSRYDQHPIFRFNRYGLDDSASNNGSLSVSVNTDDQGVFDTSLENEYGLLACALAHQRCEDGSRRYGDDAIYCYLQHLRELGIAQIFPPAAERISTSF